MRYGSGKNLFRMYMEQKKIKIPVIILFLGILSAFSLMVYSCGLCKKEIEFISHQNGIYVVSIDSGYFSRNSDVYAADFLETVENIGRKNKAKIAVNAGYFDPENGKSISYLVKNNQIVLNPVQNERLTENYELQPHIDKIFNRTEFRLLSCLNPDSYEILYSDITPHNNTVFPECEIIYSIQAGPGLLPCLDLEKEFFVLKEENKIIRQSAGVLDKYPRSAIGIKGNRVLIVVATKKAPMTIQALADLMKNLGVEKAMAFDGGSSTSLYVDLPEANLVLSSAKDNSARRVKTVLIVK